MGNINSFKLVIKHIVIKVAIFAMSVNGIIDYTLI